MCGECLGLSVCGECLGLAVCGECLGLSVVVKVRVMSSVRVYIVSIDYICSLPLSYSSNVYYLFTYNLKFVVTSENTLIGFDRLSYGYYTLINLMIDLMCRLDGFFFLVL